FDPAPAFDPAPVLDPTPVAGPAGPSRAVTLVVHVNPADLAHGAGGDQPRLGALARSHLTTLLAGCGKVTVKPVIDPMAVTVSTSTVPPPGMRERVEFRNPTVAVPFSTRASNGRHVDLDHTIPLPDGPTTEPNLGPLDRRAHRWKTHTTCQLDQVRNGTFRWTTPARQVFWVTPYGTYAADPGTSPPTPQPPRTPAQQATDLINRARQAVQRAQKSTPTSQSGLSSQSGSSRQPERSAGVIPDTRARDKFPDLH
ncbi:MAG: hypothetical protein Q4G46_06500, partial [Propionibacteriaceae bacterium]|nr:hypothetical protein [Propionibacteriaceae bacterium]